MNSLIQFRWSSPRNAAPPLSGPPYARPADLQSPEADALAGAVGRARAELSEGMAAYVARGTTWHVDEADRLEALSVLVRDPLPADGTTHAVVELDAQEAG